MQVEKEDDITVGQSTEAEAETYALRKGVVLGLTKTVAEQGLAAQDLGEGAGLVEAVAHEQAEVLQGGIGQKLGLMEEYDGWLGEAAGVGEQVMGGLAVGAVGAEAGDVVTAVRLAD